MNTMKKVLVFGATGNMGGATARSLLERGWPVRAVTRNPNSKKAAALSALGAELVSADMEDRNSLEAAFDGVKKVFSVQNWVVSGVEGEVRQGILVAEAARSAQIEHLVFGSAGTGQPGTGIPHFESKLEVEAHMRRLDLPFTILRPGPFLELMTHKEFYPALGVWGAEPKVVGWDTPKPWVAVKDIGKAAANILADPNKWLGRDLCLFGDVKSLAQCQAAFVKIVGKKPFRIPIPVALFKKMAGPELVVMWEWLAVWARKSGQEKFWETVQSSLELVPDMLDLENWLKHEFMVPDKVIARHGSQV
jgi:uncharacterized protein YbjT (DUF2867 family)